MKHIKSIFALCIFALFLIFAFQNNIPVDVRFFGMSVAQMPLFIVIIVIFILGFILGRISGWFSSVLTSTKKDKKTKEQK